MGGGGGELSRLVLPGVSAFRELRASRWRHGCLSVSEVSKVCSDVGGWAGSYFCEFLGLGDLLVSLLGEVPFGPECRVRHCEGGVGLAEVGGGLVVYFRGWGCLGGIVMKTRARQGCGLLSSRVGGGGCWWLLLGPSSQPLVGWLARWALCCCCCRRWSQGPRQFGLPGRAGLGRTGELRLELL